MFRACQKWFEKPDSAWLALWGIPAGHLPSPEEAVARLEHLPRRGPAGDAFSLAQPFAAAAPPAAPIGLDGRRFAVRAKTAYGDAGGNAQSGSPSASVDPDATPEASYRHLNLAADLRTGVCRTVPERLPDGRLGLDESWRWTRGDGSEGRWVAEEIGAAC